MIHFEKGLFFHLNGRYSTCDNVNNKQVFPCHLPESSDSCGSFSNDPLVIHFGQNFRSKSGAVTGLAFVLNSCEEQRCNMETKKGNNQQYLTKYKQNTNVPPPPQRYTTAYRLCSFPFVDIFSGDMPGTGCDALCQ